MQNKVHRNQFFIEVDDIKQFKNKVLAQSKVYNDFVFLESNCDYNTNCDYDFVVAFAAIKKYHGNNFDELKSFFDIENDYLFGSFCYDLKDEIFNLKSFKKQQIPFSKICFFIPSILIFSQNKKIVVSLNSNVSISDFYAILNSESEIGIEKDLKDQVISSLDWEEYVTKFTKLKNNIQLGNIYEVNLCNEILGKKAIDPVDTFKKLNSISSAPYAALYKQNDSWLVSSSPELYIQKKAETVITKPIKGTASRNNDTVIDQKNKELLLSSEKEKNENVMIVDLARNDLSTIAKRSSVVVSKLFDVETYKQVHQLVSTIECKVENNTHPIEIIKKTFPMASMTGVPKKRALEIIEETENFNRGIYSGTLGFFDPTGDFTFNVVIRSVLYNQKTGEFSFSVGSAITDKCNAKDEFEECLLKAKAMIEVLGF